MKTLKSKNKIKTKALILTSTLIILASGIAGIGYAKYFSQVNGDGRVEVAKWSFLVNGEKDEFDTIDLGRQSYDAKKISDGKIAPGTSGSFDITINAKGTETGLNYTVGFPQYHNIPTNMYFKVGDTVYRTLYDLGRGLSGSFDADDEEKTITKTIQWFWDYETTNNGRTIAENDAIDTADGENAYDFSFIVEVKGTQVRPA